MKSIIDYCCSTIIACEVIWLFYILKPQFIESTNNISTNDLLLHRYVIKYIGKYVIKGISPYDFFLPGLNTGFPLVSHYQHLPHVIIGICNSFYEKINADTAILFLLSTMPIMVFYGSKKLGFNSAAAVFITMLYPIINDCPPPQNRQQGVQYSYGIGINSQIHNGHGLFSQLLAIYLFFPALGISFNAMVKLHQNRNETWKNIILASMLISSVLLSNVFYGYMVLGSLCILEVLLLTIYLHSRITTDGIQFIFYQFKQTNILKSIFRFLLILVLVGSMISYFVIPFLKNRYVVNEIEHRKWKFDSVGWTWFYIKFMDGDLLDFGFTSKIITNTTFVGFIISIYKTIIYVISLQRLSSYQYDIRNVILYIWIIVSFLFWGIMFAGRTCFAQYPIVLKLLPFSSSLHFHRFISAMQIFAICTCK